MPDVNSNPYQPGTTESGQVLPSSGWGSLMRAAVRGALTAVLVSVPLAGLTALVFRFPVPFAGYLSGPSVVMQAMFAAAFYGCLLGGWVIVAVIAGTAGICVRMKVSDDRKYLTASRISGFLVALAYCLLLATLDWFIGPF